MKNNRLLCKLTAGLVSLLLAVGLTGGVSDPADLSARLAAEPDLHIREDIMTREHMRMAEKAHGLALELYRDLVK